MSNKYTYTRAHHFRSKLDPSPGDKLNDKIMKQFDLFNNEYDKLAKQYDLKNYISFDYIKNKLIDLNNSNPEFTETPIEIEIDPIHDELIHHAFLNKDLLGRGRDELMTYLFNKTCVNLGWFVVLDI
jgi:hypothetical protein